MQYQTQALSTIICEGDAIGAVALCSGADKDSVGELQGKLAQAAALFDIRLLDHIIIAREGDFSFLRAGLV